jgi:hypothetical protein
MEVEGSWFEANPGKKTLARPYLKNNPGGIVLGGPEFKPQYYQKNINERKLDVVWMPVVPACQRAEVGGSQSKSSQGKSSRPSLKNN